MKLNKNGAILYQGPSLLDGKPIVVIVTGLVNASKNDKTGAMLQTWIIRSDISPKAAVYSGQDASICGDCPHRLRLWGEPEYLTKAVRTCYVNLRTVITVKKCFDRGGYAEADKATVHLIRSKHLRMGSYGDPAAVPYGVWKLILPKHKRHRTGYTHQWASPDTDSRLKGILMASADTPEERLRAQAMGWRTFEVRPILAGPPAKGTGFQCPSDPTRDKHVSCEKCGLCNGAPGGATKSPWIYAHGPSKKRVGGTSAALPII